MFLGIDHGTTAIRFAVADGGCWELSRQTASSLSPGDIIKLARKNLGISNVNLVALSYSMGDGLTRIVRLEPKPGSAPVEWHKERVDARNDWRGRI